MIQEFYPYFSTKKNKDIQRVLISKKYSQGLLTKKFEDSISKFLDVPYVVAVPNGSIALLVSLMALDLKYGDEIIMPSRSWIASAHAPHLLGIKIKFVDVLSDKPIIDIEKIEEAISKKTKAIMLVHLNGRYSYTNNVKKIAKKYNLKIIEDSAQALGSCSNGKKIGTEGDLSCFSLSMGKIITSGQGGYIVTKSKKLFNKIIKIRTHGLSSVKEPSKWNYLGLNFKFTDLQASIALHQLKDISKRKKLLIDVYKTYKKNLINNSNFKLIEEDINTGQIPLYVEALAKNRYSLQKYLNKFNIQTRKFFPSMHTANYLFKSKKKFKNSEKFSKYGIFLPSGPSLKIHQVNYVITKINQFYER